MDISKNDLTTMKLLHYFITEKNYNPVVVHGIQNEIWLENMDEDFRIVRIVMSYIHNEEQLDFDNYKVKKMANQIRRKTFTLKMKVLSFYLDLNEDIEPKDTNNHVGIKVKTDNSIKRSKKLKEIFPDLSEKFVFNEKGMELYEKINVDILRKNMDDTKKINDLFSVKKPIVTYILIGIMIFVFLLTYVLGNGSTDTTTLYVFGGLVKNKEIYRVFTSIFLHIGFIHLIMNTWSLKIIGEQNENFYGHIKMLVIFLYSGVVGNLLSLLLMKNNVISAGASGAIFGLMGSLLYFALNQRSYMSEALKRSIIPVIVINLIFTFSVPSINMYAHIGGLIGGMLISSAVGIKYKTSKIERINGTICSLILLGALIYLIYIR